MIRNRSSYSPPQNKSLGENPFANFTDKEIQDLQVPDENEYDADLEADYYDDRN